MATLQKHTLLSPQFKEEFIERKIGRLDAKLDKKSDKFDAWSTYM